MEDVPLEQFSSNRFDLLSRASESLRVPCLGGGALHLIPFDSLILLQKTTKMPQNDHKLRLSWYPTFKKKTKEKRRYNELKMKQENLPYFVKCNNFEKLIRCEVFIRGKRSRVSYLPFDRCILLLLVTSVSVFIAHHNSVAYSSSAT